MSNMVAAAALVRVDIGRPKLRPEEKDLSDMKISRPKFGYEESARQFYSTATAAANGPELDRLELGVFQSLATPASSWPALNTRKHTHI
jgi:hypothetical protein